MIGGPLDLHGGEPITAMKEIAVSIWEALAVFAAGIGAGTINTIVGSGTLITFPVLLATGLPRSPPPSPTPSA